MEIQNGPPRPPMPPGVLIMVQQSQPHGHNESMNMPSTMMVSVSLHPHANARSEMWPPVRFLIPLSQLMSPMPPNWMNSPPESPGFIVDEQENLPIPDNMMLPARNISYEPEQEMMMDSPPQTPMFPIQQQMPHMMSPTRNNFRQATPPQTPMFQIQQQMEQMMSPERNDFRLASPPIQQQMPHMMSPTQNPFRPVPPTQTQMFPVFPVQQQMPRHMMSPPTRNNFRRSQEIPAPPSQTPMFPVQQQMSRHMMSPPTRNMPPMIASPPMVPMAPIQEQAEAAVENPSRSQRYRNNNHRNRRSQGWKATRSNPEGTAKNGCAFCSKNGEMKAFVHTHRVKDCNGKVTCPILRDYVCPICGGTGDDAHTLAYCPQREEEPNQKYHYRRKSEKRYGVRNSRGIYGVTYSYN